MHAQVMDNGFVDNEITPSFSQKMINNEQVIKIQKSFEKQ